MMLLAFIDLDLALQNRPWIKPRGAGLDLRKVEIVARRGHEILNVGTRQPLINHHRQSSSARLPRAPQRGKRQEIERLGACMLLGRRRFHDFPTV